jgi:hypothetical protein
VSEGLQGDADDVPGWPMTAVVVLGDIPTAGIIRQAGAGRMRVDARLGSDAALEFVAYADQSLRAGAAVLVLYPAWRSTAAKRVIQLARAMLDSDRIAGVSLDLPPLAFSLVADQLAYLAQHVSPGLLASLAHRLPQEVLAGAWVNSVAKLEHIHTSLGKHMTSYLPGTGFMVAAAPQPSVHRITSSQPVAQLAYRPVDPVLMLVAHEDESGADWLKGKLAPALGPQSLNQVGAQPLSADFWGTKKYVEFVAFSGHPHALQYAVRATPCRPCPWCEEPTALPTCPFCLMVQPIPQAPQQGAAPLPTGSQAGTSAAAQPPDRPAAPPQQVSAQPASPQAVSTQPATPQPSPPRSQPTPAPSQQAPQQAPSQPDAFQQAPWWYEQQPPAHGVASPLPKRQKPPPAQDNLSSWEEQPALSGDRTETVTFAVPPGLGEADLCDADLRETDLRENGMEAAASPGEPAPPVEIRPVLESTPVETEPLGDSAPMPEFTPASKSIPTSAPTSTSNGVKAPFPPGEPTSARGHTPESTSNGASAAHDEAEASLLPPQSM